MIIRSYSVYVHCGHARVLHGKNLMVTALYFWWTQHVHQTKLSPHHSINDKQTIRTLYTSLHLNTYTLQHVCSSQSFNMYSCMVTLFLFSQRADLYSAILSTMSFACVVNRSHRINNIASTTISCLHRTLLHVLSVNHFPSPSITVPIGTTYLRSALHTTATATR